MGEMARPWLCASMSPGRRSCLPLPTTRASGCFPRSVGQSPTSATLLPVTRTAASVSTRDSVALVSRYFPRSSSSMGNALPYAPNDGARPHSTVNCLRVNDGGLLRGASAHRQHHAKARAAADHLLIALGGLLQRKALDHRANPGERAEGQRVLGVLGGAGGPAENGP